MGPKSGLLYVTMQPEENLPLAQFHDWYNNEHGPNRLRLEFIQNGFRYKGIDGQRPEWMAVYDVSDMSYLGKDVYTRLRKPPIQTQRERDVMKQIKIDRKFYDYIGLGHPPNGSTTNEPMDDRSESAEIIVVWLVKSTNKITAPSELWNSESVARLKQIPGWDRVRTFCSSSLESDRPTEAMVIHEYRSIKGPNGGNEEEIQETVKSITSTEDSNSTVSCRIYRRYYTFGPAPRDRLSPIQETIFSDGITKVLVDQAGSFTAIESYFRTRDNVQIPFRLEGCPNPGSPTLLLINSILVEWGIWKAFVQEFLAAPENKKFQILMFNARGRNSETGDRQVSVDVLADDIVQLIDALRIDKVAALIGVSLGGATSLKTALKYQDRIESFVACDTNAMAPPGNPKAWAERIEIAQNDNKVDADGNGIVGEKLAELTTRRWFQSSSYEDDRTAVDITRVKKMVEQNSLEGFKKGVQALYEYDFREEMKHGKVRGMFVVGSGDGALPESMKDMAKMYGDGSSSLIKIDGAGHLPMVERPRQFTAVITSFLGA